ncbi:hypothetical protein LTR99_005023 [Exophiala xenobiotica]|uniref:Acyltransferase 3 domain-containing protein n=1 Tax=Vermiconidia calcicola TaxID=1690605 RepID=A0AAV9PS22_9PEZI|nr:hypothetical protein H2202_005572 [Exophiala xenobiotica]KAK5528226.1 hypothetical protein LTR25_010533 [Vermiconidia calcicola]KAK5532157.1 hypothetical protein LTR23_009682 [Chaetothyriales sp. CCFEE 6169]KAK5196234.1 hypothetical protein LTR92_003778 [Exophiala xenobiotica]KAK5214346.1 hypothetical protein LTR41_000539 [Exophiala xenobiotica]
MAEERQQPPEHVYLDIEHEAHYSETAPLNPSSAGPAALDLSPTAGKIPIWYDLSNVRSYGRFSLLGSLRRLGYALIPSFLTTASATTPSKTGISALDGLRGIACLFVFGEHYVICYQSRATQTWIMRVPFIRLLYYGKASVFLFFVISGYVLSCKPLKLMRAKSYAEFQKSISSSFLRRGMRLYLPCLVASFICCILTTMGAFDHSALIYKQFKEFVFLKERPPPHVSFPEQWKAYWANVEFIFSATIPFDKDTDVLHYHMYDDHQWTIPKEFRSSLAVFALLVTTSRMRSVFRMTTIAAMAIYALNTDRLYTALFFAGMLCAEFDLVRQSYYARARDSLNSLSLPHEKYSSESQTRFHSRLSNRLMHLPDKVYKIMWITLFTLGVYMISSPQEIQTTKNFLPALLESWGVTNIDDKILTYGSILVVWSVATCPSLGPLFNNPFVAYLGKISYALYLVHGTVIKSIGYNVLPWTLRMATGVSPSVDMNLEWWQTVPDGRKVVAYLLGLSIVGTTCFWLSDLFWRFVDIPCVNFARSVEVWITKGADAEGHNNNNNNTAYGRRATISSAVQMLGPSASANANPSSSHGGSSERFVNTGAPGELGLAIMQKGQSPKRRD